MIVLIPKIKNPLHANDSKPIISFCNVVSKLVNKTIANRLKNILPSPMGENQSVFVPNRLIIDNALIAFECFHYMKNKDKGRKGFIGLKLDMSKPYDRVEWCFFGKCAWGYGISKRLDFLHNDMC